MQIEINKVKISKSYIKQMYEANSEVIFEGEPLGFVLNVIKTCKKVILMEFKNDYYILPANYNKKGESVFRYVGKWRNVKTFDSKNECDAWWNRYQEVLKYAITHIYI